MDAKYNPWFMLYVLFTCFSAKSYLCVALGTISANQAPLKSYLSLALGSISADQSLTGDQTISSEKGKFIRDSSSQAVVWVANREKPVVDKYSSSLRISNGNLVLFNEKSVVVWSTNLSSTTSSSSSVEAVLNDDGNLVLSDGPKPIWQSCDDPTDTWLPCGRLGFNKITKKVTRLTSWKSKEDPAPGLFSFEQDPNGTSQYYILQNRSRIMWTSGVWNGEFLSLVPEMRFNSICNFSYINNEIESYFTYSLYNPLLIFQFWLDSEGHIQQMIWLNPAKQWSKFWYQPRTPCDFYADCGEFGVCKGQTQPLCQCLPGSRPTSVNEWNSKVYSAGCKRKRSFQCRNSTDRFLASYNILLPSNPSILPVLSDQECESSCLNNCSCIAYAHFNSKCSVWFGDLLNQRQLGDSDPKGETLYIRLEASEFSSSNNKKTVVIGVTAASVVTLLLLGLALSLILRRGCMRKIEKISGSMREITNSIAATGKENDKQLALFSFKSILAATNRFSEANKLGEGGFGPVYKGNLPGDQQLANKRLSKKSGQGLEEFMNELKLIANLQHKNLVMLLGCCVEREEKMLIYEYMPNRSLDKILFDPYEKAKLVWDKRFKIVEGVAQGLLYIHKFSRLKVIHRDLKASNILLDEAMNPKISDFGMARIFGINQTEANTNRVMGTYCYMSPEYAFAGQFSEKSDVYSFGVFLLEMVSGRRNTSFHRSGLSLTLTSFAWELWKEGKEAELIDASIKDRCCLKETLKCIHVGLLCVQEDSVDRPTMSLVVFMLTTDTQTTPITQRTGFSLSQSC